MTRVGTQVYSYIRHSYINSATMKSLACVIAVALLVGVDAIVFEDIEDVYRNYVREYEDGLSSEENIQETMMSDSSVEERSDNDANPESEVLKNSHRPEIWRVYKAFDERKCDKEIALVFKSAICAKPRNRTVYLDYFSPSDTIEPNAVEVPRCDGHCSSGLSCMPVKRSKMDVAVQMINHYTKKRTCATIVVEKHDACKCGCAIREEDCHRERQVYKDCRCICRDPKAREDCELMNRQWDPQTCSCMCAERGECSTGEMFHEISCRCERYMIVPKDNEIY